MNALILAAGRGTRLGPGDDMPKCLTRVGSATLLDRYLDALDALGTPVTIVVGHGAEHIREHVSQRAIVPALVTNPEYTKGSVVSLHVGLSALGAENASGGVLLLDGDVAFTPALLANLHNTDAPDALLVDIGTVFTDEQYMAGVNGQRVLALRRGPVDGFELQGEWVGFARLAADTVTQFRHAVAQQIARGGTAGGYEDALAGLLGTNNFTAVPTLGLPWVEIDFPADLQRARELFPT